MSILDKLGSVLTSSSDMLNKWFEEPLKRSEHTRTEQAKQAEHDRLVKNQQAEYERLTKLKHIEYELLEKAKSKDVERRIEREIGVKKALSEQNMKEQAFLSQEKIKEEESLAKLQIQIAQSQAEIERFNLQQQMIENEFSINMQIKRETEVVRIISEIESLKKDKEFERMKAVSDAMMEYQKELTRINVEAVDAIGSMRIDLQRKAYELIHEKTLQYKKLQSKAIQEAEEQLARIDNNPNMRESSKDILSNAVAESLVSTIKEAKRFIEQLNDDMQLISKDINLITSSGQQFIQRHLQQFQLIGFSEQTTALLSQDDSTNK